MSAEEYQRIRLWAGITGITLNTALVWAAYFVAPWFQFIDIPYLLLLAVWNAGAFAIMWPYDVFSGYVLEKAANRNGQSFAAWSRDWFEGAGLAWLAFLFAGLVFGYGFYLAPELRIALYAVLLIPAGLVAFHPHRITPRRWTGKPDETYETELQEALHDMVQPPVKIIWFDEADPLSVNAYAQPTASDTIVLSSNARGHLTPKQAALLCTRQRVLQMFPVSKLAPLLLIGWLFVGVGVAAYLPSTGKLTSAMAASAVITTWCLVALFVLPVFSRHLNIAADRALAKIAGRERTIELLELLQRLNATDRRLPTAIATVFHPIPPLETRLDRIP